MFYNHFLVGLLLRHVVELKTRLFIQRNVLVAGDLRGLLIAIFAQPSPHAVPQVAQGGLPVAAPTAVRFLVHLRNRRTC